MRRTGGGAGERFTACSAHVNRPKRRREGDACLLAGGRTKKTKGRRGSACSACRRSNQRRKERGSACVGGSKVGGGCCLCVEEEEEEQREPKLSLASFLYPANVPATVFYRKKREETKPAGLTVDRGGCCRDKSMEELFSLSATTLGIDKAVDQNLLGINRPNEETSSYEGECKKLPRQGYSKETSFLNEGKMNLSREVLESLFSVPDIFEEEPKIKRLPWGLNRTRVIGQKPVTKPFDDFALSPTLNTELTQPDSKRDDEDNYQVLRKAAKQHWDTMKTYYEAAVDAFSKGEQAQSSYCLEQGKHHYRLAREADEKSVGLILEKEEPDDKGTELSLDLRAHSVNESIRLLKLHLQSLANIPSFSYLKVTISLDNDNTSRGKRRREKVLQLLEKESIGWTEVESSPGVILIPLTEIDHNKLTFQTDSS